MVTSSSSVVSFFLVDTPALGPVKSLQIAARPRQTYLSLRAKIFIKMASAAVPPQTPPDSGTQRRRGAPRNGLTSTNNITTPGGTWGVTPRSDPSRPPQTPRNQRTGDGGGVRRAGTATRAVILQPARVRPDPDLKAQLEVSGIEVYEPGHLEYERSVACSNLLYRFSRPNYVVRPQTHLQVSTILSEAIRRKMPLTIKNSGHSYIGSSFPNDGLMLDMKNMNEVHFDR